MPSHQRVFVSWREPATRRIAPVGMLQRVVTDGGTQYTYEYLKQAELTDGFKPFKSFPNLYQRYSSTELFPMFQNRLMARQRPDYLEFVRRLDLDADEDPFLVLVRSGGRKATDRIEVFMAPERDEHGRLATTFFARGIRHEPTFGPAVDRLRVGDPLYIEGDPSNLINPLALLMHAETGDPVGYVPDYLVKFLHDIKELCDEPPEVAVVHINGKEHPANLRLLCRVVTCAPASYEPFGEIEFDSLVPAPLAE